MSISEITTSQIFLCHPQENTSRLSTKIYGQVDSAITLSFHSSDDLSKHIYQLELGKGIIDTSFFIDWYSEPLTTKYHPKNCTEGNLTIVHNFY